MRWCAKMIYLIGMTTSLSCAETVPTLPTQKDAPQSGITHSIFDSFGSNQTRQDHQRAQSIADSLESLPGVVKARIHLTTPKASPFQLPDSQKKGGAAVLLVTDGQNTLSKKDVKAFLLAAVPELKSEAVQIFPVVHTARPSETIAIGPLEVTKESAPLTRLIIGGLLVLCLAASLGLIAAGVRLIHLRKLLKTTR